MQRGGNNVQLKTIGEAGILAAIDRIVAIADPTVIVGIGDDAAVLQPSAHRQLVVTTDMQLESVHFKLSYATPYDIGWKAMAVNLSDIAAMGGVPRYAVISLALRPDLELRWIEDLYRGLREVGAEFGVTIVGGNLAKSPGPMVVDVTALGEVEAAGIVRRTGAKTGDRLLVTGALGASAAGRHVLERGVAGPYEVLAAAHLRPHPRVHEGRVAAHAGWATAMIDLSDGLATDLWRLCETNNLGVRVDGASLPISASTRDVAVRIGVDVFNLAVYGGEDYELLIAASPTRAGALATRLRDEVGTPATMIGEFVDLNQGRHIEYQGKRIVLEPRGWDHFSRADGS